MFWADWWLNLDGEIWGVEIDYLAPLELGGGCLVINTGLCPVLFIALLWSWKIESLLQGMNGELLKLGLSANYAN